MSMFWVSTPTGTYRSRRIVEAYLRQAGITLNGSQPWDIRVHDERFYDQVLRAGDLGLGESYMRGWWDCPRLDELACRVLKHNLLAHVRSDWRGFLDVWRGRLCNLQTPARAPLVGRRHYDLGNDFFEALLGPTMVYSCAYWKQAADLDTAQEDKLALICRKLRLERDDHVLDVGCGWGTLARHIALNHGCRVTGITISRQQCDYAVRACAGLPVRILLADYRSAPVRAAGPFTKVVSVGMFEHVGSKNYRRFMEIAHGCLPPGGLFLLHAIGTHGSAREATWVKRYIFPNSEIPTLPGVARAIDGLFVMEDWHNFGAYYDRTLMAWYANFEKSARRKAPVQDPVSQRMWRYYLLSCAGSFRARNTNQLWQVVLSKGGVPGGYQSVR